MPHPLFVAHTTHLDALRASRLLDAAQAAAAVNAPSSWWDALIARARGVAVEMVRRAGPMFTFNARPINSSQGLRQAFGQSVSTRVES